MQNAKVKITFPYGIDKAISSIFILHFSILTMLDRNLSNRLNILHFWMADFMIDTNSWTCQEQVLRFWLMKPAIQPHLLKRPRMHQRSIDRDGYFEGKTTPHQNSCQTVRLSSLGPVAHPNETGLHMRQGFWVTYLGNQIRSCITDDFIKLYTLLTLGAAAVRCI